MAAILVFSADAVSASGAVLMDGATGRILFEKQAHEMKKPASTTKIMTALIVCEQCNVLDRVRIPKAAVGIEGSSMYLQEGEILTVQELLYGLMLQSGNDAAVALAIYCGGTVEGFTELMNDKAARLGLKHTHFENPNGLDSPGHYSTSADLATLARYAMQNPVFAQTVSTRIIRVGERQLRNHNKLLWRIPGADGVKTGFTRASGRILVSSAMRNGRRLIAVTMNAPDDWQDHEFMLEQGFSKFGLRRVVEKGQVLGFVEIAGGQCSRAALIADENFDYTFMEKEEAEVILPKPDFVYAPVVMGQKAGTAWVMLGDQCVGKIPLIYGKTVERKQPDRIRLWDKLLGRIKEW